VRQLSFRRLHLRRISKTFFPSSSTLQKDFWDVFPTSTLEEENFLLLGFQQVYSWVLLRPSQYWYANCKSCLRKSDRAHLITKLSINKFAWWIFWIYAKAGHEPQHRVTKLLTSKLKMLSGMVFESHSLHYISLFALYREGDYTLYSPLSALPVGRRLRSSVALTLYLPIVVNPFSTRVLLQFFPPVCPLPRFFSRFAPLKTSLIFCSVVRLPLTRRNMLLNITFFKKPTNIFCFVFFSTSCYEYQGACNMPGRMYQGSHNMSGTLLHTP